MNFKHTAPKRSFAVKLLLGYAVFILFIPEFLFFLERGNLEQLAGLNNPMFVWCLFLCIPAIAAIVLAALNFRRMPYFATVTTAFLLWHLYCTLTAYFSGEGFDESRLPLDSFNVQGLFLLLAICSIPFVLAYGAVFAYKAFSMYRQRERGKASV